MSTEMGKRTQILIRVGSGYHRRYVHITTSGPNIPCPLGLVNKRYLLCYSDMLIAEHRICVKYTKLSMANS